MEEVTVEIPPKTIYKTEALLLLVVVIWASNFPLAKYALSGMDLFMFNAVRYFVAAVTLACVFVSRKSQWIPIQSNDWRKLLTAGFIASVIYQVAFIVGLSFTTAGNSAIILATSPLWTVFLNARLHRERIESGMWVGMAISLLGIILIITGSGRKLGFTGSYELIGDIVTLIAAALWGLNTNLQKPLLVSYSPVQLALVFVTIGAVGLSILAIPSMVATDWVSIHWTYYLAAIVSGSLSIGIANMFWSDGVKRLGPGRTANFSNLVPVFAFIFSYFTLGERLLPIQLTGAAVTIIGVWFARRA